MVSTDLLPNARDRGLYAETPQWHTVVVQNAA